MSANATVETELAGLRKDFSDVTGSLKDLAKALDKPQHRVHGGEGVIGYWGSDGETIVAPVEVDSEGRPKLKAANHRLPKGYKNDVFKSAGQFYRELITHAKAQNLSPFYDKYTGITKAIQGMSTQIAADGGAWVLPEFASQILDRINSNDLWSRTDGYNVSGNNLTFKANAETSRTNGQRHGGLRGYWAGEGATITKSKPTTRDVTLKLCKAAVVVYLTDELMEDAPALERYVREKAAQEFEFLLGDAIINGNGVAMPLGILNSPALLSVAKETGQAAATIVTENVDKMWARRIASGKYVWLHNQDCGPQLDRLSQDIGTSGAVLNRPNGIGGEMYQTLKTAPRLETEFNATVGTVGDLLLADLSRYLTISKGGIVEAASVHVEFLTDQTALRFTMRVDGRPADISPITPFKGSNTQSPFVALATRS